MSNILPISNTNATPKQYLDNSRPISMIYADETFKTLASKHGSTPEDLISLMTSIAGDITSTKSFEISELWGKIEQGLNNNRPLSTKGRTDANKAQVAVSFFYNALNMIDLQAKDTESYLFLKGIYTEVKDHVEARFLSTFDGKDQRVMARILDTIDGRFEKVAERMNASIEAGEMAGPAIPES